MKPAYEVGYGGVRIGDRAFSLLGQEGVVVDKQTRWFDKTTRELRWTMDVPEGYDRDKEDSFIVIRWEDGNISRLPIEWPPTNEYGQVQILV